MSAFFVGGVGGDSIAGAGSIQGILSIFDVTQMIPTYWLQIVIGVYLIEIVFILTSTLVTIKSGRDPVAMTAEAGKNLKRSMLMYLVVAIGSIVGLSIVGSVALAGLG